ncbi:MAG: hypothetical protein ACR2PT_19845 [Endozoicomonas sp.]
MKKTAIEHWVELKKQTPVFEQIINYKRKQKKATTWDDMALFFIEADRHLK